MQKNHEEYIRERNIAFLTLDKQKIVDWIQKYNPQSLDVEYEDDNDEYDKELIFWAGVHKVRACITSFPDSVKELSLKWLSDHGFKPL